MGAQAHAVDARYRSRCQVRPPSSVRHKPPESMGGNAWEATYARVGLTTSSVWRVVTMPRWMLGGMAGCRPGRSSTRPPTRRPGPASGTRRSRGFRPLPGRCRPARPWARKERGRAARPGGTPRGTAAGAAGVVARVALVISPLRHDQRAPRPDGGLGCPEWLGREVERLPGAGVVRCLDPDGARCRGRAHRAGAVGEPQPAPDGGARDHAAGDGDLRPATAPVVGDEGAACPVLDAVGRVHEGEGGRLDRRGAVTDGGGSHRVPRRAAVGGGDELGSSCGSRGVHEGRRDAEAHLALFDARLRPP